MFKKKKKVIILTLCLITSITVTAFAESCLDMVGDWEITCESAYYEPLGGTFGYTSSEGILHIIDQSGCFFQTYFERTDKPDTEKHGTGVINGKIIRGTVTDSIFDGILKGQNSMDIIISVLEIPENKVVNTALCSATR